MTLGFQDCRSARPIANASATVPDTAEFFECYGGSASGVNLGASFSFRGGWGSCAQANNGVTGHSLAEDLASVDVLFLEGGTNDIYNETLGSITDTASTNSTYGYIRRTLEQLIPLKPSMRIVWITPIQMTAEDSRRADQMPGIVQAILSVCAQYGVPVINMLANSGFSKLNGSVYLQADGIHPNQLGFTNLYARYINAQLAGLNPID